MQTYLTFYALDCSPLKVNADEQLQAEFGRWNAWERESPGPAPQVGQLYQA